MSKKYFSDRENGIKVSNTEDIKINVFNAIINVYVEFENSLALSFPERDDYNNVRSLNKSRFRERLLGDIPNFTLNEYGGISSLEDNSEFNKYALLDFIEFCWENINDYKFGRYGLLFVEGQEYKNKFRDSINKIFQRNEIVFRINENGEIERILPMQLEVLVKNYCHRGNDNELNKLIDISIKHISKPKIEDRQIAIEKLWDAFERIKTYYDSNKKQSVKTLINMASEGSKEFEALIEDEMLNNLTKIGNQYRIRHHETDKIEINSVKHIDYLYYRMMSLINLLVSYI